jgi:hypothetical protein
MFVRERQTLGLATAAPAVLGFIKRKKKFDGISLAQKDVKMNKACAYRVSPERDAAPIQNAALSVPLASDPAGFAPDSH